MRVRPHAGKESVAPKLPGTYFKFVLEKPPADFDVLDSEAEAKNSKLPYGLMHMAKPGVQARVVVLEPTTAVDVPHTPTDAPSTGPDATPDRPESPDEVTGLIERLSLPGAASNSDGGTGAGDGGGGAFGTSAERALALKTKANQHFSAGEYFPALTLYSEAIEVLEGAGENAALATILCNRSVAFLKLGESASALADAESSKALGGGKAHFRRAEALLGLMRYEEALEAFGDALVDAVSHCAASTHCS